MRRANGAKASPGLARGRFFGARERHDAAPAGGAAGPCWWTATSRPRPPTGCGWPTSPTFTWAGFLYLAVALDAFSRRIVGWSMATHLRAELVPTRSTWRCISAVPGPSSTTPTRAALQYTSVAFGQRCRQAGVSLHGFGRGLLRNALCESFFATLDASPRSPQFPHPGRGAHGGVRVHRGLLQPASSASSIDNLSPVNRKETTTHTLKTQVLNSPRNRGKSIAFGVVYSILFGKTRWWGAVLYSVFFVELGMMTLPPMENDGTFRRQQVRHNLERDVHNHIARSRRDGGCARCCDSEVGKAPRFVFLK